MQSFATNWTTNELKTYLLLYGASADLKETPEEIKFIKSHIEEDMFAEMHNEFDGDNDYQRIQKIEHAFVRLNYPKEELDELMAELRQLFLSDGKFDAVEQNVFRLLKRILE